MEDAANIPLPSALEGTVNAEVYSKLHYATSLHSFVDDNINRHSTRAYDELYDRSNAPSRHDEVTLQDFPLPATSQARPSGRDTPNPTRDVEIDNISYHNATGSTFEQPEPIEDLRRKLAEYELPLLQQINENTNDATWDPINDDGEGEAQHGSYDLIAPYQADSAPLHSLEKQAELMFSTAHMLTILSNPRYLFKFREFLTSERPGSLPVLMYYLSACKALKAIDYSNAVAQLLMPLPEVEASSEYIPHTQNPKLEQQAQNALQALVKDEIPAFITSNCVSLVSNVVEERIKGTLPPKFQGTADALAEVFCLTDPSRPDNPIIFASEEFHRTTQYGMDYVLGRNCRFLQGPKTNRNSIDISGLIMDDARMDSMKELATRKTSTPNSQHFETAKTNGQTPLNNSHHIKERISLETPKKAGEARNNLMEFAELLSPGELSMIREHGGSLFEPVVPRRDKPYMGHLRPRIMLKQSRTLSHDKIRQIGKQPNLPGVYDHYLLVRPYPSLRILFTSPSLRIPGILQSSFFSKVGGSPAVRDELLRSFIDGRSVTARIQWLNRFDSHGRSRWVHCTPLLAHNGGIGVWMVVIVDDDVDEPGANWRQPIME
ncbi:hypothetical protein UA08_03729 [Talaromyces atroroseus]|uniref:PAS domain-containing protein n=1 Tax=Talaromyces atroroseus TaxID=1441469 RepID=A0A225AR79_TALAT|nr:hypothetical protein UA08_03729 [Talaromyces atroroseus]OKL60874.1 hypothetical protein UA08_03729 [Talaromyces atroroseus]